MSKINWKKRVTSMAILVVMLIPMLAVIAFASSPKVSYSFTFNGIAQTMSKEAAKTDVLETTGGHAGVTISSAQFGTGYVRMWIEHKDGWDMTAMTSAINSTGTYTLYYNNLPTTSTCTVRLRCTATSGVQGLGGTFQP